MSFNYVNYVYGTRKPPQQTRPRGGHVHYYAVLLYIMLTIPPDLRLSSFIDNPGFSAGRSIGLRLV